jgi:hypothetical protein
MTKTKTPITLSLLLTVIVGCNANTPPSPATTPGAKVSAQPTNENPDPNNKDCSAIKDPAQAEDCRLWKGVAAAKKKHNSDPAVKRSPGSIQQP